MQGVGLVNYVNDYGLRIWATDIAYAVALALGIFSVLGVLVMVLVYMERKVSADIQVRYGPLHVGPYGSLQLIADMVKLLTKEDVFPTRADRWIFRLAPALMFASAFMIYMIIPIGPGLVVKEMNLGVIYVLAIPAIGIAGLIMSGFGSYNRFAILGSLRAIAQMVSYEVPRGLSVLGVVMIAGSMKLCEIVESQAIWYIFLQPLGFLVFFISSLAEINRVPFDIPEAESELVSGYHTEYSGMRFAFFLFAEYLSMFAVGVISVLLFLGGWSGPLLPGPIWFFIKVFAVVYLIMWIRWTFPRFRMDQVMNLCWKVLLPLALLNILATGLIMSIF